MIYFFQWAAFITTLFMQHCKELPFAETHLQTEICSHPFSKLSQIYQTTLNGIGWTVYLHVVQAVLTDKYSSNLPLQCRLPPSHPRTKIFCSQQLYFYFCIFSAPPIFPSNLTSFLSMKSKASLQYGSKTSRYFNRRRKYLVQISISRDFFIQGKTNFLFDLIR